VQRLREGAPIETPRYDVVVKLPDNIYQAAGSSDPEDIAAYVRKLRREALAAKRAS
jgi:hypothetical protein